MKPIHWRASLNKTSYGDGVISCLLGRDEEVLTTTSMVLSAVTYSLCIFYHV